MAINKNMKHHSPLPTSATRGCEQGAAGGEKARMARRSNIDWPAVEAEYRAGFVSVRALARRHGIADSNLRARAKRESWTREDGDAARIATREAMTAVTKKSAREIGAEIGANQARKFEAVVGQTALSATEVVQEHRCALNRARAAALLLLDEICQGASEVDVVRDDLVRLGPIDLARTARVEKALGLRGRVETFDRWAGAFAKLASAERAAYQLDQAADQGSELDQLLKRVAITRNSASSGNPG